MSFVRETLVLTHEAALELLGAGVQAATEMGQPQCIFVVDASGETLASVRMTGAKYLSMLSARSKARTAASIGAPSSAVPEAMAAGLARATQGAVTRLTGGLPIYIEGQLVGGIGIGSGSPDQDLKVAQHAIAAIGAKSERA